MYCTGLLTRLAPGSDQYDPGIVNIFFMALCFPLFTVHATLNFVNLTDPAKRRN